MPRSTRTAATRKVAGRADAGHDTAALALRLAIGPMLAYHGYNKIAGDGGLEGTGRWFEALGLRPGHLHARLAAATELGAGTAMTLGVASPVPAAATVGLMTVAARTDHRGKGFFVFKGGWEYTAVVAAVALAQAALGPGRWSLDALVGRRRSGTRWALLAGVCGAGAATALLRCCYRPQAPSESEDSPT
jgi:putative oxidoreductase